MNRSRSMAQGPPTRAAVGGAPRGGPARTPPRVLPPREAVEPGLHVLRRRVLQRGLDDPVEPGIDLALAVEVGRHARRDTAAEELAPAVERRGPARVDGLDAAADLAEGRGALRAEIAYLRVHDVGEAQVRAPRDAQ